jgi:hypothetical protein
MILDRKPKRIIEVGSGYSTLIARKTLNAANINCTIEVIDPHPRTEVSHAADRVLLKYVEDISLSEINQEKENFFL